MTTAKPKNPLEEPIVLIPKDPESESALVKELEEKGYFVMVIRDPSKAQRIGEGKPSFWKPKLFVVDMILSGVSGFEVVRRLADKFSVKKVPIVMASPYQSKEDELEATSAGAVTIIQKPLTFEGISKIFDQEESKKNKAQPMDDLV